MFDDLDKSSRGKPPTFAILGAGFSGMGMAIRLRQEGIDTFTIYEKADEVGGTWRENTYPGVACDVPSHLYSFSYDPNPRWSKRYSPGEEIWDYMKASAKKYDLYRSIQFGKTVTSVMHDGDKWNVNFKDGTSIKADYVISGLGGLHEPNIPDFEGRASFNGPSFHTAQWRHDVDLKDKRVAIIGSAASAVQVIPEIVDKVSHLDVYQRTPNWVIPRESYSYPKWLQAIFEKAPLLARAYRGFYFSLLEYRFAAFKKDDNFIKRRVQKRFLQYLNKAVRDPELRAKLTPSYPVGCKRILISDDYFDAIQKENVEVITDSIERITPSGVLTRNGAEHPADVLIYATGFTPFDILASIDVVGPGGNSLKDAWANGITSHRTLAVPGFPNFFILLGPNSGLGHNSVILMIEAQVNYIIRLVKKALEKGAAFVETRPEAAEAYDRKLQAELKDRVWAAGCGAWYVDKAGRNYTLYPHAVREYLREMAEPDSQEYLFRNAAVFENNSR
jgi:cation diffusion facilitator CzcD-associated flavoprotein CzcO